MFRELAESLRQQLEEALSLPVVFVEAITVHPERLAIVNTAASNTATDNTHSVQSKRGLSLRWLGLREFVSRRTPSAYDQTAMHLSGKLEYLAYFHHVSTLDGHDAIERLLRACVNHAIDYTLVELTDPCWNALGIQAQPALRLQRPLTLDIPVGQATELVEKVILQGQLATTASGEGSHSQRKSKPD